MWSASYGLQLQVPNANPVGIIKFKDNRWVSLSVTKKNSCSASVAAVAAAPCKSNSGAVTVSQPRTQSSWVSCTAAALPFTSLINHYKPPQLGLLSLFFALSTAIGAILSLAVISIPTMLAFRKLAVSADKLLRVVSEEVPGTLSSLKLSGLEISELTRQLSSLRQKISCIRGDKKSRSNKPNSSTSSDYPILD